jgi:uncharacterized protein (TIGR02145 family)
MVENLNVDRFRNGDPIPEAKTKEEWKKVGKESKPAWCYYNNDPKNANIFGKLYNWYAVNDKRKLAPAGWHIPTKAEFETLATPVKDYGRALKAKGQGSGNGSGTNTSGYSALLAGCRIGDGGFDGFGGCAYFWSSTVFNGTPRSLGLNKGNSVTFNYSSKAYGYSVRCLKD